MAVVLVGPMGAGKTTLGKKLAKKLGLSFADTDRLIAKDHGPITKIFEKRGEDHFRGLETQYLKAAVNDYQIVATGGGIVLSEQNREILSLHTVIFLDTDQQSVIGKINLDKRPLLAKNPEAWGEIYEARLPLYKAVANHTVFTGNRPIRVVTKELEEIIVGN